MCRSDFGRISTNNIRVLIQYFFLLFFFNQQTLFLSSSNERVLEQKIHNLFDCVIHFLSSQIG